MAIGTNVARTIKNGSLKFMDGATASNSLTIAFMDGGVTGAQMKNKDYQIVRSRGVNTHFIEGDDPVLQLQITVAVPELIGSTANPANIAAATTWQVALETYLAGITSKGLSGEPKLIDVVLTENDPDGAGSETWTWAKCLIPSVTFDEGYPNKATLTILCRGGFSATYSGS